MTAATHLSGSGDAARPLHKPTNPFHKPGTLTLEKAAELFPANNAKGHVSTATLLRWIVGGKKKVKLKAVRKGGEWFTTEGDIERFRAATGV